MSGWSTRTAASLRCAERRSAEVVASTTADRISGCRNTTRCECSVTCTSRSRSAGARSSIRYRSLPAASSTPRSPVPSRAAVSRSVLVAPGSVATRDAKCLCKFRPSGSTAGSGSAPARCDWLKVLGSSSNASGMPCAVLEDPGLDGRVQVGEPGCQEVVGGRVVQRLQLVLRQSRSGRRTPGPRRFGQPPAARLGCRRASARRKLRTPALARSIQGMSSTISSSGVGPPPCAAGRWQRWTPAAGPGVAVPEPESHLQRVTLGRARARSTSSISGYSAWFSAA